MRAERRYSNSGSSTGEQTYTRAEWLDHLPITGVLTTVGPAIDRIGGSFTLPYRTLAATALKSSPRE